MFENIIGHSNIIQLLKDDLTRDSLPHSMIFFGPKGVGKLSSSLEVLRVLNCLQDSRDQCDCQHCQNIRLLDFQGLVFLSRRNFLPIIKELSDCYLQNEDNNFLNKIKYYIKLTTLPFQDYLIRDTLNESSKKLLSRQIEIFYEFLFQDRVKQKDITALIKSFQEITGLYKNQNIPVNSIRGLLDWTYISQPDIKRMVIIDHFDQLESPSQNILLKRLEEPSPNLYFILLSDNKNHILKTIKSRCRVYPFHKLSGDSIDKIITHHFLSHDENYDNIYNFLNRNDEKAYQNLIPHFNKLLTYVFQKDVPFADLTLFLQANNDKIFVEELLTYLSLLLENEIAFREKRENKREHLDVLKIFNLIDLQNFKILLNNKIKQYKRFHLNPLLTMEGIFYPLKGVIQNDQI